MLQSYLKIVEAVLGCLHFYGISESEADQSSTYADKLTLQSEKKRQHEKIHASTYTYLYRKGLWNINFLISTSTNLSFLFFMDFFNTILWSYIFNLFSIDEHLTFFVSVLRLLFFCCCCYYCLSSNTRHAYPPQCLHQHCVIILGAKRASQFQTADLFQVHRHSSNISRLKRRKSIIIMCYIISIIVFF